MDCSDINSMPILEALPTLARWVRPHVPTKLIHSHEKISDAELIAAVILRYIRKVPYFNQWWKLLTVDLKLSYPSLEQAHIRFKRLRPIVEALSSKVEQIDVAVIDSAPIPVCRYKRAGHCKFPGAAFGYGSQGKVYGYKIHAWTLLNGARLLIIALNPHESMIFQQV